MIVILSVDRVISKDGCQPDSLLYCNGSYFNIGFSALGALNENNSTSEFNSDNSTR